MALRMFRATSAVSARPRAETGLTATQLLSSANELQQSEMLRSSVEGFFATIRAA